MNPAAADADLVLWRHAHAARGFPDFDRPLTARGERQARRVGRWLDDQLPADTRCITSPAERARQTATFLDRSFLVDSRAGPDASANDLLDVSEFLAAPGVVLLVGHQPSLGALVALLLGANGQDWYVRKGSIVWLRRRARDGATRFLIHAVIPPQMLKR